MEKKISKAQVKKVAINKVNNEMNSPFAVLNYINKKRTDPEIAPALEMYGIANKMDLSMLLTINNGGERDIFCKLKKVSEIEYLNGDELQVIKIKNNYYEYIPIKFSVREFFASLEAFQKIQDEKNRIQEITKKETERKEKEEKAKAEKQQEKINQLAENLALQLPDLPKEKLLEIAKKSLAA